MTFIGTLLWYLLGSVCISLLIAEEWEELLFTIPSVWAISLAIVWWPIAFIILLCLVLLMKYNQA